MHLYTWVTAMHTSKMGYLLLLSHRNIEVAHPTFPSRVPNMMKVFSFSDHSGYGMKNSAKMLRHPIGQTSAALMMCTPC